MISSYGHFYQSYGPLFISVIKSCGINSSFSIGWISFKLAHMIKVDVQMIIRKGFFPATIFTRVMALS